MQQDLVISFLGNIIDRYSGKESINQGQEIGSIEVEFNGFKWKISGYTCLPPKVGILTFYEGTSYKPTPQQKPCECMIHRLKRFTFEA